MYQIVNNPLTGKISCIKRLSDNAFIPLDLSNTDYQKFKVDVADGVPLEDPEGNVMTQAEVDAFLATIP